MIQVFLHSLHDLQNLFAPSPIDLDERRPLSVIAGDQVHILEAVAYFGHVTQAHHCTVTPAQDDNLLEILLVVVPARSPNTHFRVPSLDTAGRQVQGSAANGIRNILKSQTKSPKPAEGHLNRYLVVTDVTRFHVGNHGKRREFIFDAVCQFLEHALGHVPVKNQANHALTVGHFPDFGTLCRGREGLDSANRGLDVVQRPADIRTCLQSGHDGCVPLRRNCRNLPYPVKCFDLFLNLEDN